MEPNASGPSPGARTAHNLVKKLGGDEIAGLVIDPSAGEVRFEAYAQRWIETRLVKGRPLSPSTRHGYRALLRRNMIGPLGAMALRKITPEVVRVWHSNLVESAGPDQAAKSYRVLRAILNTAVEDMRIGRNPCRIRGAGIEQAVERPIVDSAVILELAEAINPRLRALVLLAGFGGLRSGEMLALTRTDLDLLHDKVTVRASAAEITGAGRVVGDPKSEAGYRSVGLPRLVVDALDNHLASYSQPGPAGHVFTGPSGGPVRRADLWKEWRRAVAKVADAPGELHIHDLRHAAATMMAQMPGVTTKELMAPIGHSSPRAALIYQHATEERDRAITEYLDGRIAASKAAEPTRRRASVTPLRRL